MAAETLGTDTLRCQQLSLTAAARRAEVLIGEEAFGLIYVIRAELKTLATHDGPHLETRRDHDHTVGVLGGLACDGARIGEGAPPVACRARHRLVFTPVSRPPELPAPKGPGRKPRLIYELTGEGSLSKLFEGLISASLMVAQRDSSPCFQSATRFHNGRWKLGAVD